MTNKQINALLEKAYKSNFLDSIEILAKENKKYKQSDFFKNTRIPLQELYKLYVQNQVLKRTLFDQVDEFIVNFNAEVAAEKSIEFLEKLDRNEKFQEIIEKITNGLDPEKIVKYTDQIQEVLKNLNK